MGVFDMAQSVVAQASGIISSDAAIDISSILTDMEPRLMEMDLGPLFGLWFQSMFIGVTMWALYICIFIVIYGRMIEIYLVTSVAPIPMAAMMGKEWAAWARTICAPCWRWDSRHFSLLSMCGNLCCAGAEHRYGGRCDYGDLGCVGYTVLLCFTLFKTGRQPCKSCISRLIKEDA